MKCQHCHENEATLSFLVNWMGMEQEVHLCNDCAEKFRQYAIAAKQQSAWNQMGGNNWMYMQNQTKARDIGESPFLHAADEEIKKKRRLNALKYQLEQAVQSEEYEEAARLRDEIQQEKKGAVIYE